MAEETYAVTYGYVPDMERRRDAVRADHLEFLKKLIGEGTVLVAGAFNDPVDGAWILLRAESAAAAREIVNADPYAAAGLVRSVAVRGINVVTA